jgi:hypothetical protein
MIVLTMPTSSKESSANGVKTMRKFLVAQALVVALAMGAAGITHANDSSAQMRAGGLVLQRTNAIAMVSEDLFVSQQKIKVRYAYRNLTRQPVTLTITFPLPDREPADGGSRTVNRDDGSPDFIGFTTKVDGRAVALAAQQQAILAGRDVTRILRSVRLLVAPDVGDSIERIGLLTPAQKTRLQEAGLLDADLEPQWTLKTNFVRQQTFPVGRDVIVEHEYSPGVGGSAGSALTSREVDSATLQSYRADYCVDEPFLRAARAMGDRARRADPNFTASPTESWVSYVLKTGANWAQPIRRFRLVVDKGDPNTIVSFYGQNIRKISPTQFEMVRTNWRPDYDLDVLFLTPSRPVRE